MLVERSQIWKRHWQGQNELEMIAKLNLRDRLKALDKKEVALREKENLLLRAQQNGGYCSLLPTNARLTPTYVLES